MTDLTIDHAGLGNAASGIGSSAEDASSRLASFRSGLAEHGEPWRGDPSPVGPLIGAIYGAISQAALAAFADNTRSMGEDAVKLTAMTNRYGEAEDTGVGAADRVRRALG